MAERQLLVRILGDDADLQRAFRTSERSAKGFQGQMVGVGTSLTRVFAAAGISVGAATLVQGAREAISAASDLKEEISKSRQVFGKSSDEIERWAETTATSLGISKTAALQATGTFGNLFSVVGLAPTVAGDMSRALVQLAADLASFNNADPTDVLVALRSGLIGEAEPLRRYGVLLSEARVQQIALEDTGKKNVKALSDQEKALARYEIILRDTAKAQGDFARTSGSMANQTRILKAQTEDVQATIGGWLDDTARRLTRFANVGVGAIGDVAEAIDGLSGGGFEAANASLEDLVQRFSDIEGSIRGVADEDPRLEGLAVRIRAVGEELNRIGATQRLIQSFRQASDEIDRALQDGVITPLERAQLQTTLLGKLFLRIAPENILGGLGADVRSGLEDATAAAKVGVADLGAEIRSGIEDMSRQAVIEARQGGEDVGNAFIEGLKATSTNLSGQLAGLGEQVLRAQISGNQGAELDALRASEAKLRQQLRIQERIVAEGGAGAPTARRKIRQEILPDLRSVTDSIDAILDERERDIESAAQRAEDQKDRARQGFENLLDALHLGLEQALGTARLDDDLRALRKIEQALVARIRAEGRTLDLQRRLLDIRAQIADVQQRQTQATQFRTLGLTAEGTPRVPGVENLRQRLGNLRQAVEGTFLDTDKTQSQLDRIAKVLSGRFGKVGKDVREAILRMFEDIRKALKEGSEEGTKQITKRSVLDPRKLLQDLDLSEEQMRELRRRMISAGVPFSPPPAGRGGGRGDGRDLPHGAAREDIHIYIDGHEVEARVTRRQQKRKRGQARSRIGNAAGRI